MTLLRRVILVVLVALLPALGAEIYNQHALRAAQRAELDDEALRQARAVAAEVGRILDGTRDAMVALAAMPAIEAQDAPACTLLLRSIRGRFAAISALALIGADDRVVCASAPRTALVEDAAHWPHVRLARARGHFAVAGYLFRHWTPAAGLLATAMPVETTVASPAGSPSAVLTADIGLGWLGVQMRALALQGGAHVTIVDRHGTVLVGAPDGPAPGTLLARAERPLLGDDGPTVGRVTEADGHRRTIAVAALPDLAVLVRLDHSPAAAAQQRAALRSYAMFAAGLALALACALLLARRTIATPVERILRTVARWRAGDASARVPDGDAVSELGRIGGALNELLTAFEHTASGMRAQQAELERRVAERTRQRDAEAHEREQAQALLQQAQRMEVIGQLTGGVAHDFNNLLTAIIGNLELAALRSGDRPTVSRLLASAMRAAERGAALTQRMLAFGRQQYLRLHPIDVTALLAGMDDLLARSVGPTVVLQVATDPGLWPARADASQLELVLLNLAINARDAMPGGGALAIVASNETVGSEAVGVTAGSEGSANPARLRAGCYVRIAVRDSGTGITPATLSRVLEPFFTTKPAGKGSGLGLSMAHGVAAQSGGGLAIESRVGQGTTVSVWLPRAPAEAAADVAPEPGPPPLAGEAGPGRSILLVDDDAEVADVTQQCLEDAGFAVLRAGDGAAALALLDRGAAVDLLIADLAMPGMNGLQLADRARGRRPDLPVLLATGYADAAEIQGGDPGYPVLEKPFKAAQLLQAVGAVLRPPDQAIS